MAATTIRLDKSKPYGTCHGERVPDDPHYRVHFWQGGRMNGHHITLPFDVDGELVPDDGKTEPYQGMGLRGDGSSGPVTYQPLYTKAMREYLAAKLKKVAAVAAAGVPEIEEPGDSEPDENGAAPEDEVNLVDWLTGKAKYQPHLLRAAIQKRFSRKHTKTAEMVIDLVLDEKLVPEDQVCAELAKYLPAKVAA